MTKKSGWLLCGSCFLIFVVFTQNMGQLFYINRTQSMPMGIYIKSHQNNFKLGSTVVFKNKKFKNNLIKNIIALPGQKYCFDESGNLWVHETLVAQKSIKYQNIKNLNYSQCQVLLPDEFLVLGEHKDSYDSRYFGAIKSGQIITQVRLLWPFN